MNRLLKNNIIFIFVVFIICNCSQTKIEPSQQPSKPTNNPNESDTTFAKRLEQVKPVTVKDKLMTLYNEWNGVPYRYGGSDKSGIDCSGFAQLTYKKIFSVNIPRTTLTQSSIGKKISRTQLKQGDLVFFKRGRSFRHVGIYLENGYFMHASTSRGVTISKLDSDYWKKMFWKAKRIIDE